MYHVVFDTNVLRNEYFNSPRMKRLKRLIDEDLLKIYIPEIVKKEYITQKIDQYKQKLKSTDIINIDRFFTYNHEVKSKLNQTERLIKEVQSNIETLIYSEFDSWVSDYKIEILIFNNFKMTDVMEHYFTGGSVFKSPKSRTDIPDAMICTTIEELVTKVSSVYVLNKDIAFNDYLAQLENIAIFGSTEELLESSAIKKELDELDAMYQKFELLYSYLTSDLFKIKLEKLLKGNEGVIDGLYLNDGFISNTSILGNDVYSCTAEVFDTSTVSNIFIKRVELANKDEFFLQISFTAECTIQFVTTYSDYIEIEDDIERNIDYYKMNRQNGDSALEEIREVKFESTISFYTIDIDSEIPDELIDYNSMDLILDDAKILPLKKIDSIS